MAIRVSVGLYDRHLPSLVNRQEVVWPRRGLDRIGCDFDIGDDYSFGKFEAKYGL